jgi:hypothetical protein
MMALAFADVPRLAAILTRCQDEATRQLGTELELLLAQRGEVSAMWAVGFLIPQALGLVQRAALHGDAAAQQFIRLLPAWHAPSLELNHN